MSPIEHVVKLPKTFRNIYNESVQDKYSTKKCIQVKQNKNKRQIVLDCKEFENNVLFKNRF